MRFPSTFKAEVACIKAHTDAKKKPHKPRVSKALECEDIVNYRAYENYNYSPHASQTPRNILLHLL